MSYFQTLKDSITCLDVAKRYGLEVDSSGMARCPFHDDHAPSMKLSNGFHCFGCDAHGDMITFVSRLFGVSTAEAVRKLSADFGIPIHLRGPPKFSAPDSMEEWVSYAKQVLHRYYDLLVRWKEFLRPTKSDEPWYPLFVEALQNQATIREWLHILEFGSKQEQQELYNEYRKTVITIDRRNQVYDYMRN
jgi:hypothetical protein